MDQGFSLDRRNARIMGVCAGIANRFGWNSFIVRTMAVVLTFMTGPVMILGYLLLAWIAD